MSKLTEEQALRICNAKSIISAPGVYRVKCTITTPYLKNLSNGVKQVAIANFNCKTEYHDEASVTLFSQGDYDKAANQGMSYSVLEGGFMPLRGQMVDVVVEEVTTSNGITGLFIQSVTGAPVQIPKTNSVESFLARVNGEVAAPVEIVTAFEKDPA